ncbi:hypothetical protein [Streptomyces sp. enrichment culture]|uniref:hypothetical protein n=1 Tax=Streptomyces sp. enrichment culture TaxID=1795815 RepID=UPI003F579E7B
MAETANLIVRAGDTVRCIVGVECRQALRVGSREGSAFPAHRTTAGLLLPAEGRIDDDVEGADRAASRFDEVERRRQTFDDHPVVGVGGADTLPSHGSDRARPLRRSCERLGRGCPAVGGATADPPAPVRPRDGSGQHGRAVRQGVESGARGDRCAQSQARRAATRHRLPARELCSPP